MKPVFKEEKDFLEELFSLKLPDYFWRSGSKLYANPYDKKPFFIFKITNGEAYIKKNEIENIKSITPYEDLIKQNIERLELLEKFSFDQIKFYLDKYKNYRLIINHSGGKDSDIVWYLMKQVLADEDKYEIAFMNTTNDTADTYRHIKQDLPKDKLDIINPDKAWLKWIKEDKDYFIPSVMVRNCCSQYKEGSVKKYYDKNEKIIFFQGMRKYESSKRKNYDYELLRDDMGSRDWKYILPIVEWTDVDVWLYLLWKDIKLNTQYKKGFNRCGCLICPYMRDYNTLLIKKYYPHSWSKWVEILTINYEKYNVGKRLKWSLEEWINGAWRESISKEHLIISQNPTKENIEKLMEIKGVTYEIAEKYFQRICKDCGKKLNSDEVGFMLKMTNRIIDVDQMQCKNCYCTERGISKEEYFNMILMWTEAGCSLF